MATELRWSHARISANASANGEANLQLPGIIGQAYRVRCLRASCSALATVANAVGGYDVGLFHQTDLTGLTTGVTALYGANPWWTLSVTPGFHSEWIQEDAEVLLAGTQRVIFSNGSQATGQVFLSLGYEVVKIPTQAWALLKNRTSFEGEK